MIYHAEQRVDGYAVIGRGNDRSANIDLTERQAGRRAHELAEAVPLRIIRGGLKG